MTTPLKTTRRRLLAFGVGGTALLAGGGLLSWLDMGYVDTTSRAALSVKEAVVVKSIIEALFPANGLFPAGVDLDVLDRIDEEIFSQPPHVASDLKAAIQLIEHAPLLLGHFHRFSALPVDRRAVVFTQLLQRGPQVVVQSAAALKQLSSLSYFGNERVWGAIGYDGPWQKMPVPPASRARWAQAVGRPA